MFTTLFTSVTLNLLLDSIPSNQTKLSRRHGAAKQANANMISRVRQSGFHCVSRTFATHNQRNFKILGIQQVAIGNKSKDVLTDFWHGKLGIDKVGHYRAEKENVDEDILQIGSGPSAVEIDLMEPIDENVAPKVHIPALNHIGLWVDDIHAAVTDLEAAGIKFTPGGVRKGASGHDVCFIHPKSAVGVLVELVQAPDDVQAHFNN